MRKGTTTIIEYLPSLRTSDLKLWDTISNQWIPGKDNCLIPFRVTYELTREGLFLGYLLNGSQIEQFIEIQIEPSNLGIGEVWYFLCPYTGKKCRKLVFWQGKFVHQSSIGNHYYRAQTESAPERSSKKWIRRYKRYEELTKQQMRAYYKPMYAGNHTQLAVRTTHAMYKYAIALQNQEEVYAWYYRKSVAKG